MSNFRNVPLIVFRFHRHWTMCSTSVFGGNSSDCTSWCHGNGNFCLHHHWDLGWTSDWPQVNAGHIWFLTSHKILTFPQNLCSQDWIALSWLYRELLGKEEYWPILLSTTCIPAFLQLLILPWFPESPRYLLIDKGDAEGCKKGKLTLQLFHCYFHFKIGVILSLWGSISTKV